MSRITLKVAHKTKDKKTFGQLASVLLYKASQQTEVINDDGEEITHFLCGYTVSYAYVKRSIAEASILYVAYQGRTIKGFATLKPKGRNALYLGLICASGAGRMMLERIESDAKKAGKQSIIIDSVPHAIPIYSKLGFINTELDPKAKCALPDRKIENAIDKLPKKQWDDLNIERDKKYKQFLRLLSQKGYVDDEGLYPMQRCLKR